MTRRERLTPVGLFVALIVLFGTWVVAMPLFTSPDEAAHLFRAYAVAHGELLGDELPGQSPNIRELDVPERMAPPVDLGCYFGQPTVPASCAVGPHGTTVSSAGTYPPFWYAVVGGAARVTGQSTHQRVYRFVAALLCAALLTTALTIARRSSARRWSVLVVLGLTPMAAFLAGGVNPNAFEIAGFVLIWSLLLVVDHPRAATATGGTVVGLLGASMLLARFASAIWIAAAIVVGAVLLGGAGLRRFLNRRFLVPALALNAAAALAVTVWSRWAGATSDNPAVAVDWSTGRIVRHTIGQLPELTQQMVGVLGWLDTELPWPVYAMVAIVSGIAVVGVVRARDLRLAAATVLVVGGLAAVPVLVNAASARSAGLLWQGRYSLPLFAALGVLGAMGWSRQPPAETVQRIVTSAIGAVLVAVQVISFWAALRRFAVGTHGRIWLSGSLPWRPGVHPMVLVTAHLLAASAVVVLVHQSPDPNDSSDSEFIPSQQEHG